MRLILFTIVMTIWHIHAYAQKNVMNYVNIPQKTAVQLDSAYYNYTNHANVGAGINVHNLIDYRKTIFEDGVFNFTGMGPHFPHVAFIYYNHMIYIINSHSVINVQKQLIDAKEKLQIRDSDYALYLKILVDYVYDSCQNNDYYWEDTKEPYQDGLILTIKN